MSDVHATIFYFYRCKIDFLTFFVSDIIFSIFNRHTCIFTFSTQWIALPFAPMNIGQMATRRGVFFFERKKIISKYYTLRSSLQIQRSIMGRRVLIIWHLAAHAARGSVKLLTFRISIIHRYRIQIHSLIVNQFALFRSLETVDMILSHLRQNSRNVIG